MFPDDDFPDALLLDAGNTIVFVDFVVVSDILRAAGHTDATPSRLEAKLAAANQRYEELLREGMSHGDGWDRFMTTWIVLAGVPEPDAASAVDELRAEHDNFNLWRRLPDDVMPAVDRVRATGVPVGIVSNSEGKLMRLLERLEIADRFDVVIDSTVVGVRKPDPAIFALACARLGVNPARCIYAGDIPGVDVEGARAAGMMAALVDAWDIYADYNGAQRYRSVSELVDALPKIASARH